MLSSQEILLKTFDSCVVKSLRSFSSLFVLGILAGVYIAFASAGSSMAAFNLLSEPSTFGLGKCLAGAIFPAGLILVVLAGAELFTGNTMMLLPFVSRRITFFALVRNWLVVYVGNFVGSFFIAVLIVNSGQLNSGANLLGGMTIKIAAMKCNLTFIEALSLGILCNWLVCLAVFMATGAENAVGKIFAIFFPIWLFITSGYEHSVANMYYISAGLLAKSNPDWLNSVAINPAILESLTWTNFVCANLLPVTLGNIIGGGIFVAIAYSYAHRKEIGS
ncbi:MAG: formate/nitrite transporter family protein [Planctomycetaceae bacterium]|jgi:formate/nitrite transporter|nr:formate/nitrite transporter family protein [Planctomycetaceae bacterium]